MHSLAMNNASIAVCGLTPALSRGSNVTVGKRRLRAGSGVTTLASLTVLLTITAWDASAAGAVAAIQSPDSIEAAALSHANRHFGRSGTRFRAQPVDPRLQLAACETPLGTDDRGIRGARLAVRVFCESSPRWQVYVRIDAQRNQQVVVAAHPLIAGQTLQASDLRMETRDTARLRGAYATNTSQLIGRTLGRGVREGGVIPAQALERELLVRNGEPVTIVSGGSGYRVNMRGEALRDGMQGAIVSVRNSSSGRIIEGRVIARGTVQAGGGDDISLADVPAS